MGSMKISIYGKQDLVKVDSGISLFRESMKVELKWPMTQAVSAVEKYSLN